MVRKDRKARGLFLCPLVIRDNTALATPVAAIGGRPFHAAWVLSVARVASIAPTGFSRKKYGGGAARPCRRRQETLVPAATTAEGYDGRRWSPNRPPGYYLPLFSTSPAASPDRGDQARHLSTSSSSPIFAAAGKVRSCTTSSENPRISRPVVKPGAGACGRAGDNPRVGRPRRRRGAHRPRSFRSGGAECVKRVCDVGGLHADRPPRYPFAAGLTAVALLLFVYSPTSVQPCRTRSFDYPVISNTALAAGVSCEPSKSLWSRYSPGGIDPVCRRP